METLLKRHLLPHNLLSKLAYFIALHLCIYSGVFANDTKSYQFKDFFVKWDNSKCVVENVKTQKIKQIYRDTSSTETVTFEGKRVKTITSADYTMLSIVGTIISYRKDVTSEIYFHPTCCGSDFININLTTGQPSNLVEKFDTNAIFYSLLNDKVIKNFIGKHKPQNLEELVEMITSGCEVTMSFDYFFQQFAFHHVKNDSVAVRIMFHKLCDITGGSDTQIGFYLPIPEPIKEEFEQAVLQKTLMKDLVVSKKKSK